MCSVTVFIGMLKGMSTCIIKGVRGSWEMQDTRSSICPYTKRVEGPAVVYVCVYARTETVQYITVYV